MEKSGEDKGQPRHNEAEDDSARAGAERSVQELISSSLFLANSDDSGAVTANQ